MIAQMDTTFAKDIMAGLRSTPKTLPSKYFYDAEGDRIFQAIMAMPEYYLTDSEAEIFDLYKHEILKIIEGQEIDLIELGAGDGSKTKILIEHFLTHDLSFRYLPIDISENILLELKSSLRATYPQLEVLPQIGEYLKQLASIPNRPNAKKVLLFLGANIGNMNREMAAKFLKTVAHALNSGDMIIIGFDLKKDPQTILNAYNDPAGITASFNLNLLQRINHELGANFNLDHYSHWETYNPITGETKSHLVTNTAHKVYFKALDQEVKFEQWETIFTELSLKYSPHEINELAHSAGFEVKQNFFDRQKYFTDSLWIKS